MILKELGPLTRGARDEDLLAFCVSRDEAFLIHSAEASLVWRVNAHTGAFVQSFAIPLPAPVPMRGARLFCSSTADGARVLALLVPEPQQGCALCTWLILPTHCQVLSSSNLLPHQQNRVKFGASLALGLISPVSGLGFASLVAASTSTSATVSLQVLLPARRKHASVEIKLASFKHQQQQQSRATITCLAACPGASTIVLGMSDGSLTLFQFNENQVLNHGDGAEEAEDGVLAATLVVTSSWGGGDGQASACNQVCWNPDGDMLATSHHVKQRLLLWRWNGSALQAVRVLPDYGPVCAFHANFPATLFFAVQGPPVPLLHALDLYRNESKQGSPFAMIPAAKSAAGALIAILPPPTQSRPQAPVMRTSVSSTSTSNKRGSIASLFARGSVTGSFLSSSAAASPKTPEKMTISSPMQGKRESGGEEEEALSLFSECTGALLVQSNKRVFTLVPALPLVGFYSMEHCLEYVDSSPSCLQIVEKPFSPHVIAGKRIAIANITQVDRIKTLGPYSIVHCNGQDDSRGVFILNQSIQQDYEPNAVDALVLTPNKSLFAMSNKQLLCKEFNKFCNTVSLSHQVKRLFLVGQASLLFVCSVSPVASSLSASNNALEFLCLWEEDAYNLDWEEAALKRDFVLEAGERVLDMVECLQGEGVVVVAVHTNRRILLLECIDGGGGLAMLNEHREEGIVSVTAGVARGQVLFTVRASAPDQVFALDCFSSASAFCSVNSFGQHGPWQVVKALPDSLILARRAAPPTAAAITSAATAGGGRNHSVIWCCRPLLRSPPMAAQGKLDRMEDLFNANKWWDLFRVCVAAGLDAPDAKKWLARMHQVLQTRHPQHALLESIQIVLGTKPRTDSLERIAGNVASVRGTLSLVASSPSSTMQSAGVLADSWERGVQFTSFSPRSLPGKATAVDAQNPCIEVTCFADWFGMEQMNRIADSGKWEHVPLGAEPQPFSPANVDNLTLVGLNEAEQEEEESACVGYWRFEETQEYPEITRDLTRFNNHARLFGEYSLQDDAETCLQLRHGGRKTPHALLLEHGNALMQVPVLDSLDLGMSDSPAGRQAFTVEFYVRFFTKRDSVVLMERCGKWKLALHDHAELRFTMLSLGATWTTRIAPEVRAWNHVALSYSSQAGSHSRPHLYWNGRKMKLKRVVDGQDAAAAEEEDELDVLQFGRGLNGELLEIRFWAVERQEWEIALGMQSPLRLAEKRLGQSVVSKRKLVVLTEGDDDDDDDGSGGGANAMYRQPEDSFSIKHATRSIKSFAPPPTTATEDDDDWKSVTDPTSGSKYYYNIQTSERVWTDPRGKDPNSPWEMILDEATNNHYYYNRLTGSTTWDVHDTNLLVM